MRLSAFGSLNKNYLRKYCGNNIRNTDNIVTILVHELDGTQKEKPSAIRQCPKQNEDIMPKKWTVDACD